MPQVILKPRKARPLWARHPWVLESAIARLEGNPADGEVVDVASDRGEFIARGVFNSRSRIAVRLYTWDAQEAVDDAFWQKRLAAAWRLRAALGYDDPQGAARMVFSEGDGLSGLIIDRYGEFLVVQLTALAMAVRLGQIVPMLVELARPRGIVVRVEPDVVRAEGVGCVKRTDSVGATAPVGATVELSPRGGSATATPTTIGAFHAPYGEMPAGPVVIREHGLDYAVDLTAGQKTGWYLDQRENRVAAAGYCRGRRVLDMFCYAGGFSLVAAARGQARDVLGVDTSRKAVALAQANAERNGLGKVEFRRGEAFETLQSLVAAGERFGAVMLDPPRFARSRAGVDEALRAYHRLNRLAVDLLEPEGILVSCSCSGHVTREDFFAILQGVAQQSGRPVQILDQRGAAPDHPVAVACPETEYLKCFIARVL